MQCLQCSKGSELCSINSGFGWWTLESLSLSLFESLVLESGLAVLLPGFRVLLSEVKVNVTVLPWGSSSALYQFICHMARGFGHSLWSLTLDWFLDRLQGGVGLPFYCSLCRKNLNLSPSILLKQWCLIYHWTLPIFLRFTHIFQGVVRTCSLSRYAVLG